MRFNLTDWELSVIGLVIAIFTIKPLPLRPDPHTHAKIHIFQGVQSSQLDRSKLNFIDDKLTIYRSVYSGGGKFA